MLLGTPNRFCWTYQNQDAPELSNPGTSVAQSTADAEGTYAQIASGANIANDVYFVELELYNGNTSTVARTQLLDFGVDSAGGTSWVSIFENLVSGMAASAAGNGMRRFCFPIFIKAGSAVAIRLQGGHSSGSCRIVARFYGKPTRPELIWAGRYAETIGAITNSEGVAVTPGDSGAEGSWTLLAATTRLLRFWQLGVQFDNGTLNARAYHFDLAFGDASNKHMIIENHKIITTTTEQIVSEPMFNGFCDVAPGTNIYVRGSCSGVADSGCNVNAVGIG